MITRICITCLCFFFMTQISAQDPVIRQFYNKYKHMDNVENIQLGGWVLKLAAKFADENEEVKPFARHISRLRVMTMEEGNLVTKKEYNSLVRQLRNSKFEDLFNARDGGELVQLLIREDGDRITDVLLLISGSDSFTMVSLEGALRFKDLRELDIDIEGGDHFKSLPSDRNDITKA